MGNTPSQTVSSSLSSSATAAAAAGATLIAAGSDDLEPPLPSRSGRRTSSYSPSAVNISKSTTTINTPPKDTRSAVPPVADYDVEAARAFGDTKKKSRPVSSQQVQKQRTQAHQPQASSSTDSSPSTNSDTCFTPSSMSSFTTTFTPTASTCGPAQSKLYPVKRNNSASTGSNDLQFKMELHANPSTSPNNISSRLHISRRSSSTSDGDISIDGIIERLMDYGLAKKSPKKFPVSSEELKFICAKSRQIMLSQPMLLELAAPVKIVGDIHGQFFDLLRVFKLCGFPPDSNYLFLGDYVDRGRQSLETIVLLLCFKIKYPENFFMLRGNHESASITKMYGFYDECKRRSSVKAWKAVVDVFNCLPVAATIANKIFCVHGGISPGLGDLAQIKQMMRPTDIPDEGLLADLLWSDPFDRDADQKAKDATPSAQQKGAQNVNYGPEWLPNDRGVSYQFTERALLKFLKHNKFDLIVRGHMVVEDGYEFFGQRKLVTVFSAPNYCGEFGNWGAVMNVGSSLKCSFEMLRPGKKR